MKYIYFFFYMMMFVVPLKAMKDYLALKDKVSEPSSVFNKIVQIPGSDTLRSRLFTNDLSHLIKTNVHHVIGNKTYTVVQLFDAITHSFLNCTAYMDDPFSDKLFFMDQCSMVKIALLDNPDVRTQLRTYEAFKNI